MTKFIGRPTGEGIVALYRALIGRHAVSSNDKKPLNEQRLVERFSLTEM